MLKRKRLGEMLVETALITIADVETALKMQKAPSNQTGRRIGRILIEMGAVQERAVLEHLAKQMNISYLDLPHYLVDPIIPKFIPEHMCRRHLCIAVNKVGNRLTLAMEDPLNIIAIDDIQMLTGLIVKPVIASGKDIAAKLDEVFKFPVD
ncbi:MAG: hypothetical protein HQM09_13985 [Candidatus Riflebacteria bacterium]|nr:hypothetical protein [Candidatus Riflebacteria bacterium]